MNTIDVVVKELKDLRKHLDTNFPSKTDLRNELKGYATKDDLKNELKRFATKDDLKREIKGVINYMDDSFVREH